MVTCRHKNGQQNIILTCFFRFSNNNFPLFLSKRFFAIFLLAIALSIVPFRIRTFDLLLCSFCIFKRFVHDLYVFLSICSCYRCITCCYVTEQLYSNSNINIDNDDTIAMNKGTWSMTKQIWLSAVKCLINKTHGNLQHPIVLKK